MKRSGTENHYKNSNIISSIRSMTAIIMVAVLLVSSYMPSYVVLAARNNKGGTKLTLSTAKNLAIAKSERIEGLELSIDAKEAARTSALKSLKEKQRNMSSFRWSPLLSFKLPTKPNEQQAFEFQYKPIQLQNELEILEHQLDDRKLDEYEKVSNYFVDIVSCEEMIDFYTDRRSQLSDNIGKLKAKVKLGTAVQGDVDKAEAKLRDVDTKLSNATSKYERAKVKLGNMIGMNVTNGYSFENPFVSAELSRNSLSYLENYAVARDQTLYESSNEEKLALLSLRTNYSLMSSYYGSKIKLVSNYVTQVINGGNLDKRAFKKDYDAFLKKIDDPWRGSYKIWFIKFPKEWLKGSLDGIRYIEDDPYVLYQNAIDYQSARKDKENTQADLIATIDDGFDNYVESRKAYLTAVDELTKAEQALILGDVQFMVGKITADEYTELENAYNTAVTDETQTLADFSETTYTYDRQTCGGVSAFFASQNVDMTAETKSAEGRADIGGKSVDDRLKTLVPVYENGITYSLEHLADENMFELRIDVPTDFSVKNINYYELWCDNVKIGDRTAIRQPLRHMLLATNDITEAEIRFFSSESGDGSYISTSALDPGVSRGTLEFIKDYNTFTSDGMIIGSYDVTNSTKTGTLEIKLKLNDSYGVSMYAVKTGNIYKQKAQELSDSQTGTLYLKENTKGKYSGINDTYSYLDAVSGDLEALTIEFTDEQGNKLFEAMFSTKDQSIVVPRSQLEYINNYQSSN